VEQIDGVKVMHGRNDHEYKLPELPHFIVDGYSPETRTVYEYFGCHWHGHTWQHFRDLITLNGDMLAETFERTMSRLKQITRAGYLVKFQLECEFDDAGRPELLAHPIVHQSPLRTRDALYGGRTKILRLHYKARENETIQYVDVMSLYPYICTHFKFPVRHPVIHVGDGCRDIEACLHMHGLIKCSIVTPEKLYHPVLRFRCNK